MRKILAGMGFVLLGAGSLAAQGTGRRLQFSLDRPGAAASQYTLAVDEAGKGVFLPHLPPSGVQGTDDLAGQPEARPLQVGPAVVKKLFAAVPAVEGGRCETHSKGIAQTGAKTVSYTAGDRHAQCTFNYSDDDRLNDATTEFQALAETMEAGQRLAAKLRFDRLGLDTELDALQHAADEGRALELGNIRPVLESILANDRVMDRVHRKAERLLDLAGGAQAGAAPSAR